MEQRIKIRIAEREYSMKASTPQSEELIRLAATSINSRINGYLAKYPDKPMTDILSFVALNEVINGISMQRKLDSAKAEAERLKSLTDSYLDEIGG
ncbi:MAG: cell division protein ZapA [Bacteroidales bacterium]|nr:cell division protein ZapA [Bacteroidales bacterium]